MCRSYCRPCVPRRFSDLAFTSAEVVGAVEMLRRAVASGDDISALFGEWSGLERQTLVRAINTPATGLDDAGRRRRRARHPKQSGRNSRSRPRPGGQPTTDGSPPLALHRGGHDAQRRRQAPHHPSGRQGDRASFLDDTRHTRPLPANGWHWGHRAARDHRLPRRRRHEGRPHGRLRDDRRDQAGARLETEIRREVHVPHNDRELRGDQLGVRQEEDRHGDAGRHCWPLVEEARLGRVVGPTRPPHWDIRTTALLAPTDFSRGRRSSRPPSR